MNPADINPDPAPVLTWQRIGGIAGFCDGVLIYADGQVIVTTCEGERVEEGTLSPEQQVQLESWLSHFDAFEIEEVDPAVADAMSVRVEFVGSGTETPSEIDRQATRDFAASVHAEFATDPGAPPPVVGSVPPVSDEGRAYDAARDALAARLGVDLAAMELVEITREVWPDGCLGLSAPGEMCTMALVPGFRVVVDVSGTQYVVRTNQSASDVRVEGVGTRGGTSPTR